ncbi:tyrosine-type recombinase/integrase [Novosphingobium colocasiae]|uniref:tyrosine-type recombinase/integrase n=1 Tax=Novosphingobium colocasiae TaxID=1256513 RepID=UPI0035AFEB71
MATRITKTAVDDFGPQERQAILWDTDIKGFGLRVMPSGAKSYVFQYRMGGRGSPTRRYTIGRHGPVTPDQARKIARDLSHQVARGVDPMEAEREAADAKAQAKEAAVREERRRGELAFDAYAERFLSVGLARDLRPRTREGYESTLRKHIVPALGSRPLPEIMRGDVIKLLDAVPAYQPAVRRMVFAVLRMVFNFAVKREDITDSPLAHIDAPKPATSRDRVLSDREIALALRAADTIGSPFGDIYALLFATGQRREEVAALRWGELDRPSATWTLPRERSKNGEANVVPLNARALAAIDRAGAAQAATDAVRDLESAAAREGCDVANAERETVAQAARTEALEGYRNETRKWPSRGLVFSTTGSTAVSGYSRAKLRLDAKMLELAREDARKAGENPDALALAPWRLHDARRTLATKFQQMGIRFEVVEAVLNHRSGASRSGVAAVYQRHAWGPEKREALDRWSTVLDGLVEPGAAPGKVVPIRAA